MTTIILYIKCLSYNLYIIEHLYISFPMYIKLGSNTVSFYNRKLIHIDNMIYIEVKYDCFNFDLLKSILSIKERDRVYGRYIVFRYPSK